MKLFAVVDRLLLGVLRIARVLLGLALFGWAMLLAVVLALCVLFWALLRGRRPGAVRAVWRHATTHRPFQHAASRRPPETGDVVDVAAREVTSIRPSQGG